MTQYRRAMNDALDPAGWKDLRQFLRLWAKRALAVSQPGYYEARDAARQGTGGGMATWDSSNSQWMKQLS